MFPEKKQSKTPVMSNAVDGLNIVKLIHNFTLNIYSVTLNKVKSLRFSYEILHPDSIGIQND